MSTELEQQILLTEKLNHLLKGNLAAVDFCMNLTFLVHVWDDLIDKDKIRSDEDINNAFRIALISIPSNPFYLNNISDLRPMITNMILQWESANVLERGSDHDKHMAYMLRAGIIQVFNYCVYLAGGADWEREVGPDVQRLYEEQFEDFMEEVGKCQIQSPQQ